MTSPARGELRDRWTHNRANADRKPEPNITISQTQAHVLAAVHADPDLTFIGEPHVPRELRQ